MLLHPNLNFMQAVEILQKHQLKKTSARLAIIETLQSAGLPITEDDISEKMGSHYDRITFYRNMQTLENSGIVHRINVDRLPARYALNNAGVTSMNKSDHAHFFCYNCMQIVCIEEIHPGPYRLPVGFQTSEAALIIKGLCNKCNK
jgi:Fur family transcriptional regulator, ferric uptake regulator